MLLASFAFVRGTIEDYGPSSTLMSIDPAISFFSGLDSDMSRHDLLCGPDDILRFIRLMMSDLAQQIRSKPKLL